MREETELIDKWKSITNTCKDVNISFINEVNQVSNKAIQLVAVLITITGFSVGGLYYFFNGNFVLAGESSLKYTCGILSIFSAYLVLFIAFIHSIYAIPSGRIAFGPEPRSLINISYDLSHHQILQNISKSYELSSLINWIRALKSRYNLEYALYSLAMFAIFIGFSILFLIDERPDTDLLGWLFILMLVIILYYLFAKPFSRRMNIIKKEIRNLINNLQESSKYHSHPSVKASIEEFVEVVEPWTMKKIKRVLKERIRR